MIIASKLPVQQRGQIVVNRSYVSLHQAIASTDAQKHSRTIQFLTSHSLLGVFGILLLIPSYSSAHGDRLEQVKMALQSFIGLIKFPDFTCKLPKRETGLRL